MLTRILACLLFAFAVMVLCLPATLAADPSPTTAPAGPQVTLIGSVMDSRMCVPPVWDHKQSGDHTLILYALDGTPDVKNDLDDIMKQFWPNDEMDCEQAIKFQDEMTSRLRFYLTPSPAVDKLTRDLEYPSHAMSVTGVISQRDGKKWIDVTQITELGPAKLPYPAKMMLPDKPLIMPTGDPLIIKITDAITLKFIKIPAGKFLCGSPFYESPRWQDEFPHQVTLTKPYYMAEVPVTQAMFTALMGTNPSQRVPTMPDKDPKDPGFRERMRHLTPDNGPDFAVENATWAEIEKFCQILGDKTGRKVRVPTQGEWEWAARVGTSSPCFSEKYVEQRSYLGDKEGKCEPVKLHKPNAWGLYDMVKSGWEMVSDYKADNIRETAVDPQGPPRENAARHGSGPLRRMEGGSYRGDTHLNLHGAVDEAGNGEEGIMIFRLVIDDDQSPPKPDENK